MPRFLLAALLPLLAGCDGLWDNGRLSVAVSPTPARVGDTLTATVANGTQREATYNACANITLDRLDGSTWTTVVPSPGSACTTEISTLRAGASVQKTFATTGLSAGTYRVAFRPTMDGGEALELSPSFSLTAR